MKQLLVLLTAAVLAAAVAQPAFADTLFSDLGPSGSVYLLTGSALGTGIYGAAAQYPPMEVADLFTVSGTGSEAVSQIDLGIQYVNGVYNFTSNTFQASIYTGNAGAPGAQVANATWSLTSSTTGACCNLVTISGITGVTLTGGTQYFMVLAPQIMTDTSWNVWELNGQGIGGLTEYSTNGANWTDVDAEDPYDPSLNAFDVLSGSGSGSGASVTPEPSSLALLGTGLAAMAGLRRRFHPDLS